MKKVVSNELYPLMDRLQACMMAKYPERGIWSNNAYYDIAFHWMGKETQLLEKVTQLEKELKISPPNE